MDSFHLCSFFGRYGRVVDLNRIYDKKTGEAKGFAFIAYEDQRSTILAVDNLNGATVRPPSPLCPLCALPLLLSFSLAFPISRSLSSPSLHSLLSLSPSPSLPPLSLPLFLPSLSLGYQLCSFNSSYYFYFRLQEERYGSTMSAITNLPKMMTKKKKIRRMIQIRKRRRQNAKNESKREGNEKK